MFTGIVEAIGTLRSVRPYLKGIALDIESGLDLSDDRVGDSIAVDGVCLSITGLAGSVFTATASAETLSRSTLGKIKSGARLNLERALTLSSRIGGHLVMGHVDCVGTLQEKILVGESTKLRVGFDRAYTHYLIEKGSVAIDGVSLTINEVGTDSFCVNIIPITMTSTSLTLKGPGDRVNLEFDLIGKYIERLLHRDKDRNLEDLLKNKGYL
ncbi:MAG TPA: riboflavin synthase [Deltaproteobacteria bacterium]|nr:riboflavin synthase [Deltaproteobacteria bacterium]